MKCQQMKCDSQFNKFNMKYILKRFACLHKVYMNSCHLSATPSLDFYRIQTMVRLRVHRYIHVLISKAYARRFHNKIMMRCQTNNKINTPNFSKAILNYFWDWKINMTIFFSIYEYLISSYDLNRAYSRRFSFIRTTLY